MWSQRMSERPRGRPAERLNHTPPPSRPSRGVSERTRDAPVRGRPGKVEMRIICTDLYDSISILRRMRDSLNFSQAGIMNTALLCLDMQLNVAHQKSHINEDFRNTNTLTLKESLPDDDLQGESNSKNTQTISSITSSSDSSLPLLRSSDTDFCIESTSFEDSLSSFPSPEVFRGGEFLDFNDSTTEGYLKFKNSTLLDTSQAVGIENMHQFSNLSAILDNSICKILPETEKTPDFKTKQTKFSVPIGKKDRGLLTSSPSSETGRFETNLSPVQKLTSEGELNPNTSNYIYSDEIVPASSSEEEKHSWESQGITPEMCCIIKTSPKMRFMKVACYSSKGVSTDLTKESLNKERLKTRRRMNTVEGRDTHWKDLVMGPRTSVERLAWDPCLLSEVCCIVKSPPRIRCTKMPCCSLKGMSEDMAKKQVDKEKLKTKERVDTIKGRGNQWREKVPCISSDICCIVKESPRIRRMKMTCCAPKRVPKGWGGGVGSARIPNCFLPKFGVRLFGGLPFSGKKLTEGSGCEYVYVCKGSGGVENSVGGLPHTTLFPLPLALSLSTPTTGLYSPEAISSNPQFPHVFLPSTLRPFPTPLRLRRARRLTRLSLKDPCRLPSAPRPNLTRGPGPPFPLSRVPGRPLGCHVRGPASQWRLVAGGLAPPLSPPPPVAV
ncbi:meiosis-specific kinetochore protein [Gracilinanus agilis]|uniref:meiosis-specific kinetochore protein n=1 Tax=Gracilinanus agilis TaxID=191870 RepID=UPI001CFCAD3D|nr:meiosis-specific kinetochore protein [Gracilinanus agilis]